MTRTSNPQDPRDVLEHNVSSLLETGGARPQLSDAARARIRAELITRHGAARGARTPLVAVGLGLAAMAAAVLIVSRFVGGAPGTPGTPGVPGGVDPVRAIAGAEIVRRPDARVTELGARHLRVEGAALIDVEPGKGAFVVETAHGRIEVLGTRFLVDAARDRTTAAVVRGEVKLATDAGDVVLHAGEQAVAEPGRAPVRGPAPRLSHLVSWAREARHRDEGAAPPVHHGSLFARDPGVRSHPPWGDEYPLPIARLGVDVVIEDQVARVALDQTFHNAAPQALEGVYRFAIPPDAALQRLAMYVDGKLVESGVVERMAARRIYEELVYRRIDPALLEWAGTGRLALRVYPIPALQDKRLMVAYTQSLPKLYRGFTLAIPLPEVDQPVGAMDVSVRVKGCAGCELSSTSHPIEVARDGADAIVRCHRAGERTGDSFVLRVRDPRQAATVATASRGGEGYLLVRAPVELGAGVGQRPYRPRTWVILDDVSASRSRLALRAQADVVDAFVRELDENDRVAVVAFDVEARTKLAPTRVLDVDRRAVRQALDGEGGVGATDVGLALDAALPLIAGVDPDDAMIVYLGDGVITSGAAQLDALRARIAGKAHFVGVGIGDGPDTQTLQGLAAATGGYATAIDLADDLGWRTFDLVAALHTSRVTGLAARLVDSAGQPVPATAYLGSPQLADGEELELVAKLTGPAAAPPASVELTGMRNGQPWRQTIALPVEVALARQVPRDAGYLPRLWAQRHIAARLLAKHEPVVVPPCSSAPAARGKPAVVCPTEPELREARDEAIRKEVVGLGKQYFLLSRHTSLLVLENDAMYARYGVTRGAGETWAPYAMPRTIPVITAAAPVVPSDVAGDAELIRAPIAVFYDTGAIVDRWTATASSESIWAVHAGPMMIGAGEGGGGFGFTRGDLRLSGALDGPVANKGQDPEAPMASTPAPVTGLAEPQPEEKTEAKTEKSVDRSDALAAMRDPFATFAADARAKQRSVVAGPMGLAGGLGSGLGSGLVSDLEPGGGADKAARKRWGGGQPIPARYVVPTDQAFDDLTAWVPALFPDAADRWRAQLAAGGDHAAHVLDPAAAARLTAARRALPTGVYRWAGLELAVDDARRIGWRRTTDAGLAETASFDGATWVRRYAELGLEAARAVHDDDIALGLGYLPVWIAEPSHYARWYDVTARGAHEVVLSRRVHGQPATQLVLQLDDQSRLTAILDAAGRALVEVSWAPGAGGPTGAHVHGEPVAVGFTAQPVPDAAQWAQAGAMPVMPVTPVVPVTIDLPVHLPAYGQARQTAEATGTPAWRHAVRQRMVALAATGERPALWQAYEELRGHGGVELGDAVLASGGIAASATDAQLAAALAPIAAQPVARYLVAGRAYGKAGRAERLAPDAAVADGVIRALWSLRAATAYAAAERGKPAAELILAIGDRAPELRLLGAAMVASRGGIGADATRVWDAVATGAYRNVARVAAARALFQRGLSEAAVDRTAALIADLDLSALPPQLDGLTYAFAQSRRGPAGWQLVWTTWRDRVLAGTSYDHVMALLSAAAPQGGEVTAILARAAELAGNDAGRVIEIVRAAMAFGLGAWAEPRIRALLAAQPSHDLYQLAAAIELPQGRLAEALADLEAAQRAGGDDAVGIATVRIELAQILEVARRLAAQSTGAARTQAVTRALAWGDRWRAIDPGNAEIDQRLGDLMLAVGDTRAAWRQLSSAIERDPWSGAGYAVVAEAFERQGRIADALGFWHQAVIIDQTDPTPRLREAQALIALGRPAEGDAILTEVARRTWHDQWSGVVYQARDLLERGKHPPR